MFSAGSNCIISKYLQNSIEKRGAVCLLLTAAESNWCWCFAAPEREERADEDDAGTMEDLQLYRQVKP